MYGNEFDSHESLVGLERGEAQGGLTRRQQLEPWLTHVVRLTLCRGPSDDPVSKRAWKEAREIAAAAWQSGNNQPEYLIGQVVRRLCAAMPDVAAESDNTIDWTLNTVPDI